MSDEHTLSVVVCSYNGAKKLAPCFDALVRQHVPVDVLVVDDGSSDDTASLAESYGFSVIRHERNRGISAARNSGLVYATTPLVAFCDDDCTPPDDWTEQLLAAWSEQPEVTVLGGVV
ncbi:MAG TPA: glycosyltransferase, partial [Acidimicrobiales bacterium]